MKPLCHWYARYVSPIITRPIGSLARDNGAEALDQYLQTKTIWINVTPL